jgi:3-oxoacyl-[acyl-carrier protein] reductase
MLLLITGTSKGIGYELLKQLASDENNTIIAVSRKTESILKLKKQHHFSNILPLACDITSLAGRKKIADLVKAQKQTLSVLINNAGQIVNKPFEKITAKELENVYQTNVFAPFLLIQALMPYLGKKHKSHIVNISSMGGFQGTSKFAGLSAYSSSKAAITGLTECLAEEFKTKNIVVNCLAIGAVQTEMLSKAFPGYKAPLQAHEMATFIGNFALTGHQFFNGKIIPVSSTTP